jgi:hypothetical protein
VSDRRAENVLSPVELRKLRHKDLYGGPLGLSESGAELSLPP